MMRRGTSSPKIISGGARYNQVNRPRRRSVVQWDGDDPWRMDVPVIFDGYIGVQPPSYPSISVERDIRKVTQMEQSRGDLITPWTFYLDGGLPVVGAVWVMEGIDWGDVVYWEPDNHGSGYRVRQDATFHCLEYVAETVLQINKPPPMSVPYIVKRGDTLALIAARHHSTEAALKTANNIRDGKALKPGITIMIPPQIGKN
jgi:nucleoid-associated protein YgaU